MSEKAQVKAKRLVPWAVRLSDGTLVPVKFDRARMSGYQYCVVTLQESDHFRKGAKIFCNDGDLVRDVAVEVSQ